MISETLSIMRKNYALYFVIVGALTVIYMLEDYYKKSTGSGANFVWFFLAVYVQKSILRGQDITTSMAKSRVGFVPFFAFILKIVALVLLSIISPLLVALVMHSFPEMQPSSGLSVFGLASLWLLNLSVVFALFGSWLPAGLHRYKMTFKDSFQRGKTEFGRTFWRFLLGLTLPSLLSASFALALVVLGGSSEFIVDGAPNLSVFILAVISILLESFSMTYISVILVRLYMKSEGLSAGHEVAGGLVVG
jgi:hypothetical protein